MTLKREEGEIWHAVCDDALDDEGYVLAWSATTPGNVRKCPSNTRPLGVAYKSTKNPITGTAESGKSVGIVDAGVAMVRYNLASTDSDIEIGDPVSVKNANEAGAVKKHVEGEPTTAWPATSDAATAETIEAAIPTIIPRINITLIPPVL